MVCYTFVFYWIISCLWCGTSAWAVLFCIYTFFQISRSITTAFYCNMHSNHVQMNKSVAKKIIIQIDATIKSSNGKMTFSFWCSFFKLKIVQQKVIPLKSLSREMAINIINATKIFWHFLNAHLNISKLLISTANGAVDIINLTTVYFQKEKKNTRE